MELKLEYIQDTSRLGTSSKITFKIKAVIIKSIKDRNQNIRAKPIALLEYESKLSTITML